MTKYNTKTCQFSCTCSVYTSKLLISKRLETEEVRQACIPVSLYYTCINELYLYHCSIPVHVFSDYLYMCYYLFNTCIIHVLYQFFILAVNIMTIMC